MNGLIFQRRKQLTERSQAFMNAIWEARNSGADTEEKLVSAILKITAENIQFYNAQNNLIVLDKSDMLQLAQELEE
jgi:hypothetical protein